MKAVIFTLLAAFIVTFAACEQKDEQKMKDESEKTEFTGDSYISESVIKATIDTISAESGEANRARIEKGVKQTAALWRQSDGTDKEFSDFCVENFESDPERLDLLFDRISMNYESLFGNLHQIDLDLRRAVDLTEYEQHPIDFRFAAYDPYAHLDEDFFKNKIAFVITLNFPFYTLEEKTNLGKNWGEKDWAYARMGDLYTARIPAKYLQMRSEAMTTADAYISEYNIYVGYLQDNSGNTHFPKNLKLISHWNLRDQIKSEYSDSEGLEKQRIIYKAMERIITQTIPAQVINSNEFFWNPYSNEVFQEGRKVETSPEPDTRYRHILNNFHAMQELDKYNPMMPTYIQRKFEGEFEIPQEHIEKLFTDYISSPVVKDVAALIKKRIGRDLEPFDIWYDGFKSRSSISPEKLNKTTKSKYPTKEAFANDLPDILRELGFSPSRAKYIASKVEVDPSRGAGHASGAEMKSDVSHLRTRIGEDGMDYKGYNIAIHEFGHNVEQTITLQDVEYYMLNGVPNTAFTEAWAFIFQSRDLELLGMSEPNPDKEYLLTLDGFWGAYEIMGVSLVDMRVWKWLYESPDADKTELKENVVRIAKEVWNEYYAPVIGVKDSPILAVYSHMIDYPLYLPAYPLGSLIEFQIESHIKGKNLADEMQRMLEQGRILPQYWMRGAVGSEISIEPMVAAAEEAAEKLNGK